MNYEIITNHISIFKNICNDEILYLKTKAECGMMKLAITAIQDIVPEALYLGYFCDRDVKISKCLKCKN